VQQHAGSVQDAGETARRHARQPLRGSRDDGFSARAREQRRALLVEHRDDVGLDRLRAENGNEPRYTRFVEDAVDGRRPAALRR